MSSVSVDGLTVAVGKVLDAYRDATFEAVQEATDEAAKTCKSEIQKNIREKKLIKTGDYLKSWRVKKNVAKQKWGWTDIVFSAPPHYRLTHLLEYGHAKITGEERVEGREHIFPAQTVAKETFLQKLRQKIEEAGK